MSRKVLETEKIIGSSVLIFGGMILAKFLGLINQSVLARFLGPQDFGQLNFFLSILFFISPFAIFGLESSLPWTLPLDLL